MQDELVDVVDEVPNTVNVLRPAANIVDPAGGRADVTVINGTGHLQDGRNYIDVEFITPVGAALDVDSVLDADAELRVTVNGTQVTVDGVPIPMVATLDANGQLVLTPLVPNAGETMAEALNRTGTRRFRYLLGPPGYDFPLGTAIGAYGLWVLLSKESEPLFA